MPKSHYLPESVCGMWARANIVTLSGLLLLAACEAPVVEDASRLAALDRFGHSVPVDGVMTARLIVERIDQHSGRVTFEEFQRWSANVSAEDFVDGECAVALNFRRPGPQHDWQLCTAALLHIRLSAHGHGSYEISVPVAIRQFNPIRDELRNWHGRRFFRNETAVNDRSSFRDTFPMVAFP